MRGGGGGRGCYSIVISDIGTCTCSRPSACLFPACLHIIGRLGDFNYIFAPMLTLTHAPFPWIFTITVSSVNCIVFVVCLFI